MLEEILMAYLPVHVLRGVNNCSLAFDLRTFECRLFIGILSAT